MTSIQEAMRLPFPLLHQVWRADDNKREIGDVPRFIPALQVPPIYKKKVENAR